MHLSSFAESLKGNYMFRPDNEDDSCMSDWILDGDTIAVECADEDDEDTN